MEGQGETAPCPACGKVLELFVREAPMPRQAVYLPEPDQYLAPQFMGKPIKTTCLECGQFLRYDSARRGEIIDCPSCGHKVTLFPRPHVRREPVPEPREPLVDWMGWKQRLRWVAILPAGLLASILTLIVLAWFCRSSMEDFTLFPKAWVKFCGQCLTCFFVPFVFVFSGSLTAPKHRFIVSVVLATLNTTAVIYLVLFDLFSPTRFDPFWVVLITSAISVLAGIVASSGIKGQDFA